MVIVITVIMMILVITMIIMVIVITVIIMMIVITSATSTNVCLQAATEKFLENVNKWRAARELKQVPLL